MFYKNIKCLRPVIVFINKGVNFRLEISVRNTMLLINMLLIKYDTSGYIIIIGYAFYFIFYKKTLNLTTF